jgi:hypothetical protein
MVLHPWLRFKRTLLEHGPVQFEDVTTRLVVRTHVLTPINWGGRAAGPENPNEVAGEAFSIYPPPASRSSERGGAQTFL